jgi:hypothetical protein
MGTRGVAFCGFEGCGDATNPCLHRAVGPLSRGWLCQSALSEVPTVDLGAGLVVVKAPTSEKTVRVVKALASEKTVR